MATWIQYILSAMALIFGVLLAVLAGIILVEIATAAFGAVKKLLQPAEDRDLDSLTSESNFHLGASSFQLRGGAGSVLRRSHGRNPGLQGRGHWGFDIKWSDD